MYCWIGFTIFFIEHFVPMLMRDIVLKSGDWLPLNINGWGKA